jgi:hypothetical protein
MNVSFLIKCRNCGVFPQWIGDKDSAIGHQIIYVTLAAGSTHAQIFKFLILANIKPMVFKTFHAREKATDMILTMELRREMAEFTIY